VVREPFKLEIPRFSLISSEGAHVTIFSRRPGPLEDAKKEIIENCVDASRQGINAVTVDMADATAVCSPLQFQEKQKLRKKRSMQTIFVNR